MDQALAEEAAILTAIGMLTAFGLLVLLMVVVWLSRLLTGRILGPVRPVPPGEVAPDEVEMRQRALAAVVAVTALLDRPAARGRPGTGRG